MPYICSRKQYHQKTAIMKKCISLFVMFISICSNAIAENSSQLWLRYALASTDQITAPQGSATIDIAARETFSYQPIIKK